MPEDVVHEDRKFPNPGSGLMRNPFSRHGKRQNKTSMRLNKTSIL